MILPRDARIPEDLGSHARASFGAATHLTKLADVIEGNVVGLSIDSL
jgi:hypothetical protein